MAYPLAGILSIRQFRLDAAARAVRADTVALAEAEAAMAQAEAALTSYRQWRAEECERRYQSIMGEALSMKALEDFRNELSALADAELVKEGFCREKTTALEAAEARLKKTRAAWRETDRNREKVLRHRDIWREEDAKEAAQQEDKEAEDFKPILFVDESGAEDR